MPCFANYSNYYNSFFPRFHFNITLEIKAMDQSRMFITTCTSLLIRLGLLSDVNDNNYPS